MVSCYICSKIEKVDMKRKITRQSLDELQRSLTILPLDEQEYYVGGGSGTKEDPYTYEEYLQYWHSGTWTGGYVQFSAVQSSQDNSGSRNGGTDAFYVERGNRLLEDVVVPGKRKDSNTDERGDHIETSGNIPSSDEDENPSGSYLSSENYLTSPMIVGGGGVEGGGGSSNSKSVGYNQKNSHGMIVMDDTHKDSIVLKDIVSKLESQSFLVKRIFNRFRNTPGGRLRIFIEGSGEDTLGATNYTNLDTSKLDISIRLSQDLTSKTLLLQASVLLHEIVHANLLWLAHAAAYGKNNGTDGNIVFTMNGTPGLYEYVKAYANVELAHHNIIANHYLKDMVSILKQVYPECNDAEYKAVVWLGLKETSLWATIPPKEKAEISKIINDLK